MGLTILGPHAPKSLSAPIIGIDLGTTFSLSAFMTPEGPKLVRDAEGDARVPSAIAFGSDGKVTIGWEARERQFADPKHVAFSIKRLIGRSMADLAKEVHYVPYQIVEREQADGRKVLHVRIDDHEHTPEELSALILKELVARTSAALGQSVQKAVITVPAYFDESQRQATRDAGRIAGLDVLRIVNEPTAAALAYGLQEQKEGIVAVYDFGGGTFDCSILQLQGGVFKVLSTNGDTHLGGDDLDAALMVQLNPKLGLLDQAGIVQLRDRAERIKIDLSTLDQASDKSIDREAFERVIQPFVERTIACCKAALVDAKVKAAQIDEVVLVGGSSRIPLVRRRVQELFGRVPHTELNPDEVVAMGAAVQASILSGQLRQILLLDITPLSLGIETMGGAVSRLIARNSTIPAQATERYTTFVDNQTGVDLHVLQGERELAKDCRSLGKFKLTGIPPMPAGLPQIDVTFLIDANGMLQVTAKELRSGVSAGIEVQPSHGLSRDEVERMIRESLEHAKADFEARKLANLQTKADANLRHTEKGLASAGQQISVEQRQLIDAAVLAVKAALAGADVAALQKSLDDLDAATAALAEILMNTVLAAEVVQKKLSDV